MTIAYRFLLRRGLAATLASVNEVPLDGEMVIETDTRKHKFGDGVLAYNSLPYAGGPIPTLVSAFTNDAGYLTSVNNANWSGADLDITNGGTGASSASAARANLGLAIGTDVQAYDADLTTWAGITPGTGVGTFLAAPTSANLRAALTDETGTGAAVFATAPTISAPVITGGAAITGALTVSTTFSALAGAFGVDTDGVVTFPHALTSGFAYLRAPTGRGFRFQSGTTSLLSFPGSASSQFILGYSSFKFGDVSGSGTPITLCSLGISDLVLRGGDGDVSRTADVLIKVKNDVLVARFADTGHVTPGADNTQDFGSGSFRWKEIFAGNGTINTSDERLKVIREGGDLTDAEFLAWSNVRAIVYRDRESFERKGDAARLHVGYSWQAIRAAFEAQGLDAGRYALWCEDPVLALVAKTRPEKRQAVEMVEQPFEELQIIDGVPVMVRGSRMVDQPVFDRIPVTDAETGQPVLVDGEPLVADVPVMEDFLAEYSEMQPTGETRGALRYQECSVLETAWLRRRLALVEERLAALEAA